MKLALLFLALSFFAVWIAMGEIVKAAVGKAMEVMT